jgi:branched-chain amino acid transport system substrate-binding protein
MFKRLLSIALVGIMVAAMFSGCSSTGNKQAAVIKVGVALPLTGGSSQEGTYVYNGIKLAAKEINAAGGINGKTIVLSAMDDRSDPKEAANIANLFVADKDVIAVCGDNNSSCTLAAAPIYNANHLVEFSMCGSSPKISQAGPYTFRTWNSDTYTASFDVQTILDAGYKKISILYENDDFGLGALGVAQQVLAKAGLKPVIAEGYLLGETKDFKTVITKMKSAGTEAVFMVGGETEIPAFMTQCAELGWKPFVDSNGAYMAKIIQLGGKYVEGLVGNSFFNPDKLPPKIAAYFVRYDAEYNTTMTADMSSPVGYDDLTMIADALKSGATTREDVQKYLAVLKNFDGLCGTLSFVENGAASFDASIPLVSVVIKNGKFVLYTGK